MYKTTCIRQNSEKSAFKAMLLNLCVSTPFGEAYQISWILDTYVIIHSSRKTTVMKQYNMRNCITGSN